MIIFEHVWIKWLFSLGDCDPLYLEGLGPVLIVGENRDEPGAQSNEAGKTALLESIAWILWGQSLRYGARPGDLVVHAQRPDGEGAFGQIQCVVHGVRFRITRTRHDPTYRTEVYFEREPETGRSADEWEDLRLHDGEATTARISQTLGYTFETFWYAVGFAQGAQFRFAQVADRKAATAKGLVAEVLQTGVVDDAIDAIRRHVRQDLDPEQERLAGRQDELTRALEERRTELDGAQVKTEGEIESYQEQVADLTRQLLRPTEARYALQEIERQRDAVVTRIRHFEREELARTIEADSLEDVIRTAQVEMAHADEERVCPVCGQALDDTAREMQQAFHRRAVMNTRLVLVNVQRALRRHQEEIKRLIEQLDRLSQMAADRAAEMEELEDLEQRMAQLTGAGEQHAQMSQETLEKLQQRIDETEQRWSEVTDRRDDVLRLIRLAGLAGETLLDFKSYLFREAVPDLNHEANVALQWLTDGTTRVQFDDDLSFEVLSDSEIAYRGRSEGWRRRIDLAIGRGFQRLVAHRRGQDLGLALFDDAFADLDDEGVQRVMRFLTHVAQDTGTVLVTAPDDRLVPYFSKVWRVVKEDGVSRIEVQS